MMAADKTPEPEQESPAEARHASEVAVMFWRRYNEATSAGMNEEDCTLFATYGDVGELRRLIVGGCPKHLLAKIVL